MANSIFLHRDERSPKISVAVGTCLNRRYVELTDAEAAGLAHRLLGLAKGDMTRGVEKFEGKR